MLIWILIAVIVFILILIISLWYMGFINIRKLSIFYLIIFGFYIGYILFIIYDNIYLSMPVQRTALVQNNQANPNNTFSQL